MPEDPLKVIYETFEKNGPEKVRMLMSRARYNPMVEDHAIAWLLKKDQEAIAERERAEAETEVARKAEGDEAKRVARSTLNAAWIAAAVAVLGVFVALWPLLHPPH